MREPEVKRAFFFVDGQNLFHCAKEAFGHAYPSYDPLKLAHAISHRCQWRCDSIRFYTGIPDAADQPFWHHFWTAKGAQMGRDGIAVFMRPLRYRNVRVRLPDGSPFSFLTGQEKGIDVRIALDVIRFAHRKAYDVAVLVCRDQDLSELAEEIRLISQEQNRWIKIASAFPYSPAMKVRGIDKTDWIRIDRALYNQCLDPRDYRPRWKPAEKQAKGTALAGPPYTLECEPIEDPGR